MIKKNINLVEAGSLLKKKEITSEELVESYLNNIELGSKLNCYNTLSADKLNEEAFVPLKDIVRLSPSTSSPTTVVMAV